MTCTLPESKVRVLEREFLFWKGRIYGSKKQVQRLIGRLNHACKVVRLGKLYMHNMYECLHALECGDMVKLGQGFFEDLLWWELCLRHHNGIEIGLGDRDIKQLFLFTSGVDWQYASELGGESGQVRCSEEGLLGFDTNGVMLMKSVNDNSDFLLIDLLIMWRFIMENFDSLTGFVLVVYCHRHALYGSLQRLYHRDHYVILLLKCIMTLCIEGDIALIPFFDSLQ